MSGVAAAEKSVARRRAAKYMRFRRQEKFGAAAPGTAIESGMIEVMGFAVSMKSLSIFIV